MGSWQNTRLVPCPANNLLDPPTDFSVGQGAPTSHSGLAGGSYVIVQEYLHDLDGWNTLPIEEQVKDHRQDQAVRY
jgi:deferrochelatase/peroxidase EfeB